MVGTEDLPNAVALNTTLFNSARIIGPALGAGVLAIFGRGMQGYAVCFYLNAASFAAVIGALFAMRKRELHLQPRLPREGSWRQLREGLRYARNTPSVVVMLIVMGFLGAFGFNFMTIIPLVTKFVLNAGSPTYAFLTATMAAGSVVAGLVVAYRGRPTQRLLLISAAFFTVLLGLVGLSRWTVVTAVLLFVLGFAAVLTMTSVNTRLQLETPPELRGRVLGMYIVLFVGTTPIGSYLIGVLAEYAHVGPTVLIMAGLCAVGVVWGSLYALRTRR
jgi:MFS family permease